MQAHKQPSNTTRALTRDDVVEAVLRGRAQGERPNLSCEWFEPEIRLFRMDLHNVILSATNLDTAMLREANLSDTNCFESKMAAAHLQNADLSGAILEDAELIGANLQGAILVRASLIGAKCAGAVFRHSILERTSFEEADLKGCDLSWSRMAGANLWNADLRNAELSNADLKGAWLARAKIRGAKLYGSRWREAEGLESLDWGDFFLGEELSADYSVAYNIYRDLKHWHAEHGLPDTAAQFYYREIVYSGLRRAP